MRGITGAGLINLTGLTAVDGVWRVLAVAVGCICVYTAAAAYCPLYWLLGLTTRPPRQLTS